MKVLASGGGGDVELFAVFGDGAAGDGVAHFAQLVGELVVGERDLFLSDEGL